MLSKESIDNEMARQAEKTRKEKLFSAICEDATKQREQLIYDQLCEFEEMTKSICCVSNLELSWRKTDVPAVRDWWQTALNGRIEWAEVSTYLHGALMFCDESLSLELQFLLNIARGRAYDEWHSEDWIEGDE